MLRLTYPLTALAATPQLPPAGAAALAGVSDTRVRRALARRSDLPAPVAARLAADSDPTTRRLAAARVTDTDLLAALAASDSAAVRVGVAANPHTEPEVLDEFTTTGQLTGQLATARAAVANPSTSTDAVVRRLASARPGDVVGSGPEGARVVAATRVLDAHPAAALVWAEASDATVAKAVALRPGLCPDVAAALTRRVLVPPALATNPYVAVNLLSPQRRRARARLDTVLDGRDPAHACADPTMWLALSHAGSPTLDLMLARARPGWDVAARMLTRERPKVDPVALPDLLADADLDQVRFAARACASSRIAGARTEVALLAVVLDGGQLTSVDAAALDHVCATLGDDPVAWRMLVELTERESGRLEDLATVAAGTVA